MVSEINNQESTVRNRRLGDNSGLASKTVLNFPKMDETRLGWEGKRVTKSVLHFDCCGCRPSSFVASPDLAKVRIYLEVFGRTEATTALTQPTNYLSLEPASFVSSSSIATSCDPRVAIG